MTFLLEPLVQIQNNLTELFLMMASTKITQMVLLPPKRGWQSSRYEISSNEISWTTDQKSK